MGGMKISNAAQMFSQSRIPPTDTLQQTGEAAFRFQKMMDWVSAYSTYGNGLQNSEVTDENVCAEQSSVEHYERYQYQDNEIKEQETEVRTVDRQDVEKLDDYAEEVKDILQDEFGVSEDQIEEAMQMLGMSNVDLLDTKQVTALVAQLTGCTDMSELLCSGEFLAVMQTVGQMSRELLQELGMTAEEVKQLWEMQAQADMGLKEEAEVLQTVEQTDNPLETFGESEYGTVPRAVEQTDNPPETFGQAENKEISMSSKDGSEGNTTISQQNRISQTQSLSGNTEEQSAMSQQEENDFMEFSSNQQSQADTVNANVNEAAVFGQQFTEVSYVQGTTANVMTYTQIDVNNIMSQIVEFSKVTVAEMETTLEMQLNPEQLGKIYMTVTSKDGVVSAQIMAQNEAVKEVLEAQLAELRQNMNDAGVKVEAVEVTVGSHEFERNLEQNAKQEERQAEEQEKVAKQTRRIRLNGLDELSGVMSEEETLVAQIMAEQGNSVDFTA